MKKFFLLFFLQSLIFASSGKIWIEWDSDEGQERLQRSEAKAHFWKLTRFYECQLRSSYCAIASSVMALNALNVEAPPSRFFRPYRLFTQEEFFEAQCNKEKIREWGMTMQELSREFKKYYVSVELFEADNMSDDQIRPALINALKDPKQVVIANFYRENLEQTGYGHWSPLAAYDEGSDSFLILDVARYKYPPFWVKASFFFNAMRVKDGNHSRGFLILKN